MPVRAHRRLLGRVRVAAPVIALSVLAAACGSSSQGSTTPVTTVQTTTSTQPSTSQDQDAPQAPATTELPATTTSTQPLEPEVIRVEAKLYEYLVAQETIFGTESVALVDGRLASTSDGVEWKYLPNVPELSSRTWIGGDLNLLVALDDNVVHFTSDRVTWTTQTIPHVDGPGSIPAMGGPSPLHVNGASRQILFTTSDWSQPPQPTEEDRAIYERLLDLESPEVVCSVDVQYMGESTISFKDCTGTEVASWVEPRALPQSTEFQLLAAADGLNLSMTIVDLETGDVILEPLSSVYARPFLLPVEGGVVALNWPWFDNTEREAVGRGGSHLVATWTPDTGWTYDAWVNPRLEPGVNSPLQQRPDGAVLLTTVDGVIKVPFQAG